MDTSETTVADVLAGILRRKRRENERRRRLLGDVEPPVVEVAGRRIRAEAALRRQPGEALRVIAEIKRQSPSAGVIRPRQVGDVQAIAQSYATAGAAAISVLCDRVGFGGSALDLRRAAATVNTPLLFKEFVLDTNQIDLAQRMGASMVLLLACALDDASLRALVAYCHRLDLAPVVEAANADELARALNTDATIIGINARDLHTFRVEPIAAGKLMNSIPRDRVAVYMSGVKSREAFAEVAAGRADAALIGEGLMRSVDPGNALAELMLA